MIPITVFATICVGGIAFLLHVFVALCREDKPHYSGRIARKRRLPVVVQLPSDRVFTANAIRPEGIPESAPFAIVSNAKRSVAEFYVDECECQPMPSGSWQLFRSQHNVRVNGAR